ncbi:Hypothetical protein A7982_06151 [Minicystis rosea]|nr:Hypothetical protein A7982_06151 [Minicystis rosea]
MKFPRLSNRPKFDEGYKIPVRARRADGRARHRVCTRGAWARLGAFDRRRRDTGAHDRPAHGRSPCAPSIEGGRWVRRSAHRAW